MRASLICLLLGLCSLFVACGDTKDSSPDEVAFEEYTIEQFMDNEKVSGGSLSADGQRVLVTSNRSGIYNAYTIPVAGGTPTALTQSDSSSIYGLSFFPEDDRILLQMDNNGDEVWQLYVRETGGTVRPLTQQAGARATFSGWAKDGKSFYISWSKRDARFMDLYEVPTNTLEPKLIYTMNSNDNFGGISPDQRYVAIVRPLNTNDSELFLYDFTDRKEIEVSQQKAAYSPADFSSDGRYLYYTSDRQGEYSQLYRYEISTGQHESVEQSDWDVSYAYFSHGGRYRVTGINADGKTVVKVLDTQSGKPVDFPDFGSASVTNVNISRDEQQMTFYVSSSASPSNLYVYDFDQANTQQLTNTLSSEINAANLVEAEVVRFASFDGTEIPAIYYRPKQASADRKAAALVWVHGGPGGQSRQTYSAAVQYLVNHGYAVLGVNNRGSSGYGKTFYKMDNKQHGEGDLKDCIAGKEWLAQQDYIDSTQIGILGGSYGGYMVMRAMTHTPDAFAVGINIFGVTNWLRTLKSIPPWWESFKDALYEEMGDPTTADSTRLYAISPLFHADQVRRPVMVLQGAKDPRVLQVESDEMVDAIKAQGVPVEYVLFPDEGHGFVKKENEIEAYSKIRTFLDQHLKGKENLKN